MRLRNFLKFALFVAVVLGIVGAVLKTWFIEIIEVGHNGMAPTLVAGDTVVLWRNADIAHGDIVLCRHPQDETRWVIGRVLGLNGTQLDVVRGQLTIEGHVPATDWREEVDFLDRGDAQHYDMRFGWEHLGNDEHMVFTRTDRQMRMRATGDYDGLYLLGDNRTYTGEDSRTFGTIAEGTCIGQIFLRLWASPESPVETGNGDFDILD
jgi:signal peptidase I